ncbi:MAG: aspartate--tRNA ligase [Patescibacteria group bacterium]|nr:aspartate--tRNA ligase [Patescibacteria group bacterium]
MQRILSSQTIKSVGQTVTVAGWAEKIRKLGKIIFIYLRDNGGHLQIVFSPEQAELYAMAKSLKPESVIEVTGQVADRSEQNINSKQATGRIELIAEKLEILSQSLTPPFEIDNEARQASEELRLKYRYLDLRHERMRQNLILRSEMMWFLRDWLHSQGFTEIQTPILSKSTPEGARDYLVPSRLQKGKFFALPQSPQQYKQLLMVAGFEKYFQIAPCFRDEDARADRSPGEFYQLDIEMAFISQDDILKLVEEMVTALVKKVFPNKRLSQEPWPRLKHDEAIKKYGTDKPDLRKNRDNKDELAFAWIVDFPLFTKQTKEDYFHGAGDKLAPSHHMFTAPKEEDLPLLDTAPEKVNSYQHDLVLNGFEVGGGSIRIHQAEIQEKVFDIIGFTKDQKKQFKHLLTAFQYGVPPHGGIAPGIERLLMAILGEKNLKEVIAFPLTSEGRDPMMDSPTKVTPAQLRDLGLRVDKS